MSSLSFIAFSKSTIVYKSQLTSILILIFSICFYRVITLSSSLPQVIRFLFTIYIILLLLVLSFSLFELIENIVYPFHQGSHFFSKLLIKLLHLSQGMGVEWLMLHSVVLGREIWLKECWFAWEWKVPLKN